MIYATHDADSGHISPNAHIVAFDAFDDARNYLLAPYDQRDWRHDTAAIAAGRFGDCWVKSYTEPRIDDGRLLVGTFDGAPFAADQLHVSAPGQHPSGRAWWVDPMPDVLVVVRIDEVV